MKKYYFLLFLILFLVRLFLTPELSLLIVIIPLMIQPLLLAILWIILLIFEEHELSFIKNLLIKLI